MSTFVICFRAVRAICEYCLTHLFQYLFLACACWVLVWGGEGRGIERTGFLRETSGPHRMVRRSTVTFFPLEAHFWGCPVSSQEQGEGCRFKRPPFTLCFLNPPYQDHRIQARIKVRKVALMSKQQAFPTKQKMRTILRGIVFRWMIYAPCFTQWGQPNVIICSCMCLLSCCFVPYPNR